MRFVCVAYKFWCLCCVLVCVLLAESSGAAGDFRRGLLNPPGGPDVAVSGQPVYLMLLTSDHVRRDLSLTPIQAAQITSIQEDFAAYLSSRGNSVKFEGDTTDKNVPGVLPTEFAAKSRELESRIAWVLRASQLTRLEQLRLRAKGVFAFLEPAVQKSLALDEGTRDLIRSRIEASANETRLVIRDLRSAVIAPEEAKRRTEHIWIATHRDVLQELTAEQTEKLNSLLGVKPDFDPEALRFRLVVRHEDVLSD